MIATASLIGVATVLVETGRRFPYRAEPRRLRRGGVTLPDRGSVRELDVVKGAAAATSSGRADTGLGGLLSFPRQGSNALLVSARESQSGKPIAVMGPQTAYFAPQLINRPTFQQVIEIQKPAPR